MAAVRYIVDDVDASITFYRERLGFELVIHPGPGFAALTRDGLRLLLNAPGAGGAGRAGGSPVPGGWNRFQLVVRDLPGIAARLREAGVRFRGEVTEGRGGSQLVVEDPSGNPVELFEPSS